MGLDPLILKTLLGLFFRSFFFQLFNPTLEGFHTPLATTTNLFVSFSMHMLSLLSRMLVCTYVYLQDCFYILLGYSASGSVLSAGLHCKQIRSYQEMSR